MTVSILDHRAGHASGRRKQRLDTLAFCLILGLVAIPGLAVLKFAALLATLIAGTLRGDFHNRGWLLGALVAMSLAMGYFTAFVYDVNQADRDAHAVRIFSFYAAFASVDYVRKGLSTPASIDRLCLVATTIMACLKVGILVAVGVFGYSLTDALEFFGFESVTLGIAPGVFRLQFPSDFIVLFLLASYTGGRMILLDFLFIAAVGIVVFLSFSRFIFLCFFVGLLVRTIWVQRADIISWLSGIVLAIALVSFGGQIIDRFVGEGSDLSDEIRVEQVQELVQRIRESPAFGNGIGSSVPNFLRSETLPYSYEVQWYATVMQLGFIGTGLLILTVLSIVLWQTRTRRSKICLALLLVMWVLAGFTNPFITSLGSAVGLSIARQRSRCENSMQSDRRRRRASDKAQPDK